MSRAVGEDIPGIGKSLSEGLEMGKKCSACLGA